MSGTPTLRVTPLAGAATKSKRIFVTGGTGFIGTHFVRSAIRDGHDVVSLVRSPNSKPRFPVEPQPQWLQRSMPEVSESELQGCEVLVHLAAHGVTPPYDNLENCLRWNLVAPLTLFNVAARAGVKRFVVAGTYFEYGRAGERYEFTPPDAPLEPKGAYAASKAAASIAFGAFAAESGAQLSIHRIFQAYGEGESAARLWPSLRRAALAGEDFRLTAGEQVRDFVPVEKVVDELLAACADSSIEPGRAKITNLGTGKPQSVRAFAEYWWKQWNASGKLLFGAIPYRESEVMRCVPEI